MTVRRPLVQVSGYSRELPAGDSVAGIPAYFPVLLSSGVATSLDLSATYSLPILLSSGTSTTLPVTLNG